MTTEITDWFKRQRRTFNRRKKDRETGQMDLPRDSPPRTLLPEDWADDNTDTVGGLPDDPSRLNEELIEKLFGTSRGSIETKY